MLFNGSNHASNIHKARPQCAYCCKTAIQDTTAWLRLGREQVKRCCKELCFYERNVSRMTSSGLLQYYTGKTNECGK